MRKNGTALMGGYETTTLWRTAFAPKTPAAKPHRDAINLLRASLLTLESKIEPLLATIPESCRGLTIHDITHVHQLWEVASIICGPKYPINPLEGFVLGAAFLIHDSGLTAAAYPGGLPAIKGTKYYLDRVGSLLRAEHGKTPSRIAITSPPEPIAEIALFDTLRAIHAKQAETILENINPHPLTGLPYPLFPDSDLFLDCGEIIGLVAASHHWPIKKLQTIFAEPRTAPARFPAWHIDALKLACILRTADACAIDERRARIMPFILSSPEGVSRDHWVFQALLNPGAMNGQSLSFQSKRPFSRQQMPAWWLAFDAIKIADRELRDCNQLLRIKSITGIDRTFAARDVDGANNPERLKDIIRVGGWTPVDTSVRIENPISLIESLGGRHLYGDDHAAPLRELIQNAADAIRARRTRLNGYDESNSSPGTIEVSIKADERDNHIHSLTVSVADDGIGMEPDVLTGTLLDFGRSLWGTEEAAGRHPGLSSDPKFKPTGRFGIGFYAIFMIADDVRVISRPWNAGVKDAKTLHFRSGVKSRAELRDFDEEEDGKLDTRHSTVIRARIAKLNWPGRFASLSAFSNEYETLDSAHFWSMFERTLRQLVFALDVKCCLSINGRQSVPLNRPSVRRTV
jgi:hypothetical protein